MNSQRGTSLSLHVREFNPPDNYEALCGLCLLFEEVALNLYAQAILHLYPLDCQGPYDCCSSIFSTRDTEPPLYNGYQFQRAHGAGFLSPTNEFPIHPSFRRLHVRYLILRRHSTLKKLTFLENERLSLPGPIHLPHLRTLNVPHDHYASFVLDDVPLTSATVMIHDPNFNLGPTWRLLSTIPQLRAVGVICGVQHFDDAAELEKVAAHIPHIEAFSARRPGLNCGPGTLLPSDVEAIATHLKKLPSLSYLELDSHFDELELDEIEEEIRRWSEECETLVEVIFNGQKWKWDNGVEDWTFTPREAYIVA